MVHTLKDSFRFNRYSTYRQEEDRECFLHPLSSFLCKHCICGYKCDYSIVDMPSLRSARYICLAANSICFRYAQTRYDINPRSRSEHIELLMAHSCHQQYIERGTRISKICISGFISMRTCSAAGTLREDFFKYIFE